MNYQQLSFLGDSTLQKDILELGTPYQFFSFLFFDKISKIIKNQTTFYTIKKVQHLMYIRQFIGSIYYMSVIYLSRVRNYWSNSRCVPIIQAAMFE